MCLAVPGRLVEWLDEEPPFALATVEFGGVRRQVNMQCVPDAKQGDYVLVHAGIAISQINPEEAEKVFDALEQLDLVDVQDEQEPHEIP